MSWGPRDHCKGSEAEPCFRALSQARQCLEQIHSCVAISAADVQKWDYLLDAAKQIRLALERDVSEDYEEAFNFYKNGVDLLLSGLQVDSNTERREAVKHKIAQYLKRAEEIFNCHLQKNLGTGPAAMTGYSSLSFRPIRILCSAVENLKHCKVLRIIDKVQLVQDPQTGATFILKSLPKSQLERRKQQTIIPWGVPFMVTLLCYYTTEDAIFLQLEHVEGGKLWSQLQKQTPTSMEVEEELSEGCSPFWKISKFKNSCLTATVNLHSKMSDAGHNTSYSDNVHLTSEKHIQLGNCCNHSNQSSQELSPDFSTISCGIPGREVHHRVYTTPVGGMTDVTQAKKTEFRARHASSFSSSSILMNQRKSAHLTSDEFQRDGRSYLITEVPVHQNLASQGLIRGCSLKERGQNGISSGPSGRDHNMTVKVTRREVPYALVITSLDTKESSAKAVSIPCTPSLAHSLSSAALPTREITTPVPRTRQAGFGNIGPHYPVISSRTLVAAGGSSMEEITTLCQDGDIPVPAVQSIGYPSHPPGKAESIVSMGKVGSVLGHDVCPTRQHAEVNGYGLVSSVDYEKAAGAAWDLPEMQIKQWAAELVLALEGLHQQGVTCYDLNPRNILLDSKGHIRLTYFGQWTEVERQYCSQALEELYAAPDDREASGVERNSTKIQSIDFCIGPHGSRSCTECLKKLSSFGV